MKQPAPPEPPQKHQVVNWTPPKRPGPVYPQRRPGPQFFYFIKTLYLNRFFWYICFYLLKASVAQVVRADKLSPRQFVLMMTRFQELLGYREVENKICECSSGG